MMLRGPGGGGCRLSDDGDRDGDAESLLEAGDKVRSALPLAACFLVRGIYGNFLVRVTHHEPGQDVQDVRLSVQVSSRGENATLLQRGVALWSVGRNRSRWSLSA
jgi:hypothetical protein